MNIITRLFRLFRRPRYRRSYPNLANRFDLLAQTAPAGMLETIAASLLQSANAEGVRGTNHGIYLASIANELRAVAFERLRGGVK